MYQQITFLVLCVLAMSPSMHGNAHASALASSTSAASDVKVAAASAAVNVPAPAQPTELWFDLENARPIDTSHFLGPNDINNWEHVSYREFTKELQTLVKEHLLQCLKQTNNLWIDTDAAFKVSRHLDDIMQEPLIGLLIRSRFVPNKSMMPFIDFLLDRATPDFRYYKYRTEGSVMGDIFKHCYRGVFYTGPNSPKAYRREPLQSITADQIRLAKRLIPILFTQGFSSHVMRIPLIDQVAAMRKEVVEQPAFHNKQMALYNAAEKKNLQSYMQDLETELKNSQAALTLVNDEIADLFTQAYAVLRVEPELTGVLLPELRGIVRGYVTSLSDADAERARRESQEHDSQAALIELSRQHAQELLVLLINYPRDPLILLQVTREIEHQREPFKAEYALVKTKRHLILESVASQSRA